MDGCYIYDFEKGLYVRSGCFFDTKEKFIEKVKKVHKGTKFEKQYLLAIEIAETTFN